MVDRARADRKETVRYIPGIGLANTSDERDVVIIRIAGDSNDGIEVWGFTLTNRHEAMRLYEWMNAQRNSWQMWGQLAWILGPRALTGLIAKQIDAKGHGFWNSLSRNSRRRPCTRSDDVPF